MPLLEVANLNRRFGGLHAVNDVSFTVTAGMVVAMMLFAP
jgi:ABC-type branched-subunit amino acid transport system ATPase component